MEKTPTANVAPRRYAQLQRRLTAAESLCMKQAEKIEKLRQENERLKKKLAWLKAYPPERTQVNRSEARLEGMG